MHCGIKRRHSCLSEGTATLDGNHHHQQSLLELSIHKLQDEQAKHGIEPRLLRFVLINNAMRALQSHLIALENEDFTQFRSSVTEQFLSNTLSHGLLSSPPSPPTPVKVAKLDNDHFPSSSPLASNSCSFPTLGCQEVEDTPDHRCYPIHPPSPPSEDHRVSETISRSCKRGRSVDSSPLELEEEDATSDEFKRKRPRPLQLSLDEDELGISAMSNDEDFLSPSDSTSSLSPIDFAKVDVSLYDFDARTNLAFPQVVETPRPPSTPSSLSCSMQAQAFISSPKLEHLDEEEEVDDNEEDETTSEEDPTSGSSCSGDPPTTLNDSGTVTNSSASNSSSLSITPDGVDNFDDTHEIDRIVSLLMA